MLDFRQSLQLRNAGAHKHDVETPSDYEGVAHIDLDAGGWKMKLKLQNAGFEVDANKAVGA